MKTIHLIIPCLLVSSLCLVSFTAGYYKHKLDSVDVEVKRIQVYTIIDSKGVIHRSVCNGYELINADTVELCEGKRIHYKQKSINVKQK